MEKKYLIKNQFLIDEKPKSKKEIFHHKKLVKD